MIGSYSIGVCTKCRSISIQYVLKTKKMYPFEQYVRTLQRCVWPLKSVEKCVEEITNQINYSYCTIKFLIYKRQIKKSRIRETKNLSTDADSRNNSILEKLRDLFFIIFFLRLHDFCQKKGGKKEKKGGGGPMRIVALIFLFPLASKKGLIAFSFFIAKQKNSPFIEK